jgi:hypothetical protein
MNMDANERPGTLFSSRRSRRRSVGPAVWGLGLLVVIGVAVLAGWLWFRSRTAPETPSSDSAYADSVASGTDIGDEPLVLPPLGASDAVVREVLRRISHHPQLAAWLAPDDLVRRFVEAVVDISRGSSPVPALEMLIPAEPFSVQESGGRLLMHPQSHRRYDLLGEVFTSLDTERTVRLYHQLLPLFQEAYRELGVTDGPFEDVLARAVGNLLAVQVPAGPFEVREAVNRYVFVDPRIESLTPAAKHLYRLGPDNAGRVQEKLRDISDALELEVEAGAER